MACMRCSTKFASVLPVIIVCVYCVTFFVLHCLNHNNSFICIYAFELNFFSLACISELSVIPSTFAFYMRQFYFIHYLTDSSITTILFVLWFLVILQSQPNFTILVVWIFSIACDAYVAIGKTVANLWWLFSNHSVFCSINHEIQPNIEL